MSIINTKLKHVDLISFISALWETSQFETVKEHVYGHQDNLNCPLNQLEKLNCRVDNEAKDIFLGCINSNSSPPVFRSTNLDFGTVSCGGILVTSWLQATL